MVGKKRLVTAYLEAVSWRVFDQYPEVVRDLIRAGDAGLVSFNMSDEDLVTLMQPDWTMTASDGGYVPMGQGVPHPRNYGTFPRRIHKYVMQDSVVTLAHAIRSMTSLPAAVFRVEDRGVIRAGAWADIVVFDLTRVRDLATFTDPHQLSQGMVHVLVNGGFAVFEGEFTDAMHGEVLRRRE